MTTNRTNQIAEADLDNYHDFISFCLWYPDLFLDIITPESGGMRLHADQRVMLRSLLRFAENFLSMSRAGAKSFIEILAKVIRCIFIPNRKEVLTTKTRENAAALVKDKMGEIKEFFPAIANEIIKDSYTQNDAEVLFASGARLFIVPCSQTAKSKRSHGIDADEYAQLNMFDWKDAVLPTKNQPRLTIGDSKQVNPFELTTVNKVTTAWFKHTEQYKDFCDMADAMAELKGNMVISADWRLPCLYGRGEPESVILAKKETESPMFFALNYENEWLGSAEGGFDIAKVLAARVIAKPELSAEPSGEYIVSMDVAHSQNINGNKSSIAVLKLRRHKDQRVRDVSLVNLITLANGLNFTEQTIIFKSATLLYNAKIAVCDANGLGQGLMDECLKEQFDADNDVTHECWDTINTANTPQLPNAKKCLYALTAQGKNHEMVMIFKSYIESHRLLLLESNVGIGCDIDSEEYKTQVVPHVQTDFFIEEISNLKLVVTASSNKVSIEQISKKIDKDRYSSVAMGLYYIETFENKPISAGSDCKPGKSYNSQRIHSRRNTIYGGRRST